MAEKKKKARKQVSPKKKKSAPKKAEGTPKAAETTAPEEAPPLTESGERTIGDIVEEEGLVTEPERESMVGKEGTPELSEIMMRIDRIDGKLELFKGLLDAFNERLIELNERLGDTRRMVFDREKWASKLEADFDKVSTIVNELDPEKIVMRFEKFNTTLDKENASLERMNDLAANISARLKVVEDKLADVTSLENVMKAGKIVEEKLKKVQEAKIYSDKVSAKIEAMFLETNERVAYMKENLDKIEKHETMVEDLLKELEGMKFQIEEELIKKREADELIESVKDIIIEEIVGINPMAFDNLRRRVTMMENRGKSEKELQAELTKYSELMDQVERDFQMGRIKDEARDELKTSTLKKMEEIQMVLDSRRGKKQKTELKKTEKFREKIIKEEEASEKKEGSKEGETGAPENKEERGKMAKLKDKLLSMGKR
ncbi:hypothetical protein E2P64_00365 [Candidatus Bathyarchaeota archaeon]|nr:hypothetical protein E2P64_00365 [Candidatus Bathyarchaeota archaeon]